MCVLSLCVTVYTCTCMFVYTCLYTNTYDDLTSDNMFVFTVIQYFATTMQQHMLYIASTTTALRTTCNGLSRMV